MGRYPVKNYDNRSFIEIWYSLPDAGKDMLRKALKVKKLHTKISDWMIGCIPIPRTQNRVVRIVNETFGILTRAKTLFPPEYSYRRAIIDKCKEVYSLKKWNGAVKWPTLTEPNRRPEDDEIENDEQRD